MISAYVMANVVPENSATLNEPVDNLTVMDPGSLAIDEGGKSNEPSSFVRRDCDCVTSTGRCMPHGSYQCFFTDKATMVQCVVSKWETVGVCPRSCKTLFNDQAYCI